MWWYPRCYDVQSDIDIFPIVESDSEIITVWTDLNDLQVVR